MKKLFTIVILAMITLLAVGLFQNYQNTPERGCTRYDASTNYWGYNCNNKPGFYEAK